MKEKIFPEVIFLLEEKNVLQNTISLEIKSCLVFRLYNLYSF